MSNTQIKRVMETDDRGVKRQIYPITHIDAVDGLADALKDKGVNVGVTTINGQSGDVTLPVIDTKDFSRIMAVVKAFESGAISKGNIELEKIKET